MKIETIRFNDSIYLSRLSIDINICLHHINNILSSQIFLEKHKDEYKNFAKIEEHKDKSIPFSDSDALKELYLILFCRIWDVFILYLKNLILAAELEKNTLSKTKADKIDNYRFTELKEKLHELNICPKDQPQWDDLKKVKTIRDKITHEHKLGYLVKGIKFQSIKTLKSTINISPENIFNTSKSIMTFCKRIDREFLKNYPSIPNFISSQKS